MSYFNTTGQLGLELVQSKAKALTQEQIIMAIFQANRNIAMTPETVLKQTGKRWPLTSVRRAITCLTKDGKLTKTDSMVKGNYGAKVHCWVMT